MDNAPELLKKVETLQNMMISRATGGTIDYNTYADLREELLAEPLIKNRLPRFVETCRDVGQFWSFIKTKFGKYQERSEYIWNEFRPVFEMLEGRSVSPVDDVASIMLSNFDVEHVHRIWQRALERRSNDPEGAITLARTLLETVCKHILDERNVGYEHDVDLPKLYYLTAEQLQLAPNQHSEAIFRQVLGGCQTVVNGLSAVRNRLSDAHGQGKRPIKPAPRHAELAVNLAGTVATFLVATWAVRNERSTNT